MTLKEQAIRDYISKIDFHTSEWKVSDLKEDMKRFLGEQPAIEITYKKDVMINEDTKKPQEFLDIDRMKIVFFDLDDKYKKIEFLIGK
jgi:hypothetical protein